MPHLLDKNAAQAPLVAVPSTETSIGPLAKDMLSDTRSSIGQDLVGLGSTQLYLYQYVLRSCFIVVQVGVVSFLVQDLQ